MKRICFVDNIHDVAAVVNIVASGGETVIVCDALSPQSEFKRLGVTYRTRLDYLSPDYIKQYVPFAQKYMEQWYRFDDMTLHDGFHIGSVFATDVEMFTTPVLYIETLFEVLRVEQPDEIFVPQERLEIATEFLMASEFSSVECSTYVRSFFSRTVNGFLSNPYVRYLRRISDPVAAMREIADYLLPVPGGFSTKGKAKPDFRQGSVIVPISHRNILKVVIGPARELERRGYNVIYFVENGDSGVVLRLLEDLGIDKYIVLGDLFNDEYLGVFNKLKSELKRNWDEARTNEDFLGSVTHRGVKLLKYIDQAKLGWFVTKLSPYWGTIYRMLYDFMEKVSCAGILCVADRQGIGRISSFIGKQLEIPSMEIQHGGLGFPPSSVLYTDAICAWSDLYKSVFTDVGISPERVFVTGYPPYDTLVKDGRSAVDIKKALDIPLRFKRLVIWAPVAEWVMHRYGEDHNERTLESIRKLAPLFSDTLFILKPHPADNVKGVMHINKPLLDNVRIDDKNSFVYDYFLASDIVMTWNSTVVSEAVIADKPIIGLNFSGVSEAVPCASVGVAVEVNDIEELKAALEKMLGGSPDLLLEMKKARAEYIEKYLFKVDGKASQRVADEIEKMMQIKTISD